MTVMHVVMRWKYRNIPSATDVRNSDDSPKMSHEHSSTDAEDGSDGDVETTVAVYQHRM